MSISSTVSRNDYTGTNSTATYAYSFKIFNASDLRVITRSTLGVETTLTINTDYTVSGVGNKTGGTITLLAGNLATGVHLTIRRSLPLTQNTDIRNQGDYYPETIEDTFDKATFIDQQQQDHLNRTVSLPQTFTTSDFDPKLPTSVVGAASVVLATNPSGTGFTKGPTLSDISTAISLVPTVNTAVTQTSANVTASAASASAAATSATQAAQSVTDATTQVGLATGQANNAQTSANTAVNAATLAKDWANKTSANVDGSEFSAKYYAQVASATVASKINRTGDTMTGPLGLQSILRLEQEINSALTGANVTIAPTRSNYKFTGAVTSIRNITPPAASDGALVVLTNGIGTSVTIQNLAGTAGSQIATGTGADVPLLSGGTLWLYYDLGSSVWRIVGATGGSGGSSLPNGGTTGQVLAKVSNTNGDANWFTLDKTSVGLGNVDNTSDATKTVLNAQNVLGTVPIANGGTGATTRQNALNTLAGTQSAGTFLRSDGTNTGLSTIQVADVPTLNQNTTGNAATATTAGSITGVNPIANGGTGETTQQAALNALSGAQTSGRYLRSNGTNVSLSQLAAADITGTVAKANGGSGADNTNLTFPTTGTLATLAGAETLTNKTLTAPLVSDSVRFTSIATPSAPTAGSVLLYSKSSDGRLYYQTSAGLEQPVQGPRVQKNYLLGGDGETGLGMLGAGYTDTAVPTSVVTGGTSRITITTSSPLSGSSSVLFTPISTIGGNAIPFTLDRADFGAILQGDITLELGGTGYLDGALQFWIVAPSGAVIQPAGMWSVNNFTGIGRVRFTFQTEITGTQYYLKVHQSTTVSTWTAKMEMTLVRQIVALGAFVSDPVAYVPTIVGFGTPTAVTAYSWRDGAMLKGWVKFTSGTPTATLAQIGIGFAGASGNVTVASTYPGSGQVVGKGNVSNFSTTFFSGITSVVSPGINYVFVGLESSSAAGQNAVNGNAVAGSGTIIELNYEVQIAGWGTSQVLSQDAGDGRLVALQATSSTAVSTSAPQFTLTATKDTTGSLSGGLVYTIPVSGTYNFSGYYRTSAAVTWTGPATMEMYYSPNGGTTKIAIGRTGLASGSFIGAVPISGQADFTAGTQLTFYGYSDVSTTSNLVLNVTRVSTGNQQIAASESVSFRFYNCTTSMTSGSGGILVYPTRDYESHTGSYNTTTGVWTCPSPGKYSFVAGCGTTAVGTSSYLGLTLRVNSVGMDRIEITNGNARRFGQVSGQYTLKTGDTVDVQYDNQTGVTGANGGSQAVSFAGVRVGNY